MEYSTVGWLSRLYYDCCHRPCLIWSFCRTRLYAFGLLWTQRLKWKINWKANAFEKSLGYWKIQWALERKWSKMDIRFAKLSSINWFYAFKRWRVFYAGFFIQNIVFHDNSDILQRGLANFLLWSHSKIWCNL